MAEHVQATLDRMVDGLIALRDYGNDFRHSTAFTTTSTTTTTAVGIIIPPPPPPLISTEEMSMIIGKRRSYEYLLRRRQPRQSDFLLYLQYELQLYYLIQLRYQKYYQSNKAFQKYLQQQQKFKVDQAAEDSGTTSTTNQEEIPVPQPYHKKPVQYIIQHIHTLYQRTIRQYRYSYTMVQQYVEFCNHVAAASTSRSRSTSSTTSTVLPPYSSTITKIYQTAMKYHCTNIQLWYDMIRYEYQYYQQESSSQRHIDDNHHNHTYIQNTARMGALRILFQRALRFHAQNISLWKSFLNLEWNHCQNLIRHDDDNDQDNDDNNNNNNNNNNNDHDSENQTNPYRMIQILYDSAMNTIQDEYSNLSFRIQCYQMVYYHHHPREDAPKHPSHIHALQQYILDSILQYTDTDQKCDAVPTSGSSTSISTNINITKEMLVMVRATMCVLHHEPTVYHHDDTVPTTKTNSVLQIIRNACNSSTQQQQQPSSVLLPSITMIYYGIQFLQSYYNFIVAKRQNPESLPMNHDNDTLQQIRDLIHEIYSTYIHRIESGSSLITIHSSSPNENGGRISLSDIVYEYVQFVVNDVVHADDDDDLSPRTRRSDAIQILRNYIQWTPTMSMSKPKNASLLILLAKLTMDIETNDRDNDTTTISHKYDSAIVILEQAIQLHIPIHQQPDHFLLLEQLFCLYVAKVTDRHNVATATTTTSMDAPRNNVPQVHGQIQQLLDHMILVGPQQVTPSSMITRGRNLAVVPDIPNILVACQHYVPYLYESMCSSCTEEPQRQKQWCQLVDQILLHPSNVILYQWISQILVEQDMATDKKAHSSSSDTNRHSRFNTLVHLLDTFDVSRTMTESNTLGEERVLSLKMESSKKTNMTIVQELIEYILEQETAMATLTDGKNRLLRIYDQVIYLFQRLSLKVWVRHYQQRKSDDVLYINSTTIGSTNKKRSLVLPTSSDVDKYPKLIKPNPNTTGGQRVVDKSESFTIPEIDASDGNFQLDDVIKLYDQYQIVHVKNVSSLPATTASTTAEADKQPSLCWKDVDTIYQKLNEMDQKSWCIETKTATSTAGIIPKKFLSPVISKDRAYCSFVLQHSKDVYTDTLPTLPFQEFDTTSMQYETAIWFFFGRNPIGNVNMDGRPEHTDAISHSGTWHYQLSGCKRWLVRPTTELMNRLGGPNVNTTSPFCLNCKESDLLMINTRLWFHQTIIPPQRIPSVSFARDFRFIGVNQLTSKQFNDECCTMTNVDGVYATSDISQGTIIFTEVDMPDCELHRSSTDANCEVVELEDGTNAVMASRPILSGEFFSIPESSDEEENSDTGSESEME